MYIVHRWARAHEIEKKGPCAFWAMEHAWAKEPTCIPVPPAASGAEWESSEARGGTHKHTQKIYILYIYIYIYIQREREIQKVHRERCVREIRQRKVRTESEKGMVLVWRYWLLTILAMILIEGYWNSRFQSLRLWCVLNIWRKRIQFCAVFWGRRELSIVKYISEFLKFQTVWFATTYVLSFPEEGDGRTHWRTDD